MKDILHTILYSVCESFCDTISFHYGSGSANVQS